jgi:outer membrane protein OmpA-like peptidoglycan-associated protein
MKISSIGIGFLAAGLIGGAANAQETTYGGARALPATQQGGTARAMGMGSAVVAVDQGSASLLWNPAGLGLMGCKEVGIHHTSGLGSSVQETLVVGSPLGEVKDGCKGGSMGGLAASFGYTDFGTFDGTDVNNKPTSSYSAHDYTGSVGWGKEIIPSLAGGVTLKANSSSFGGSSYSSFSTDLGLLWSATHDLDLGVTYTNIDLSGGIGGKGLTSGLRLGAGWKQSKHWLLAAATELQDQGVNRVQLGTEYLVGDVDRGESILALRGGYALTFPDNQLGIFDGLSIGAGYILNKSMSVDYAWLPAGDIGDTHRLSLTFKWGCPTPERTQKASAVKSAPVAAARAVKTPPVVLVAVPLADSHFDFDKSSLKPATKTILDKHIQYMKDHPNTTARVSGHTSAMGTKDYNQKLSERRANSVKDYLVAGGIQSDRITAKGYGDDYPVTYEGSPDKARSDSAKSNMRVDFEILAEYTDN